MTREEIEQAEGRDIDILIAIHLFGWYWGDDPESGGFHLVGPVRGNWQLSHWPNRPGSDDPRYKSPYGLPFYSIDWNAAREVVEWLFCQNWHVTAMHSPDGFCTCQLDGTYPRPPGERHTWSDKTFPVAICKAALIAHLEEDGAERG